MSSALAIGASFSKILSMDRDARACIASSTDVEASASPAGDLWSDCGAGDADPIIVPANRNNATPAVSARRVTINAAKPATEQEIPAHAMPLKPAMSPAANAQYASDMRGNGDDGDRRRLSVAVESATSSRTPSYRTISRLLPAAVRDRAQSRP